MFFSGTLWYSSCTTLANLCSATVAVMEPRLCLSSSPVRGKECLQVPLTHLMPCQSDNRKTRNTDWLLCPSSPFPPVWKTAHTHFLEPGGEDRRSGSERFPSRACLVVTKPVRHFRCQHSDTWPPALINSSWLITHDLPALCVSLTMHSVTSRPAGRLAVVNGLVLDRVQPHGSCCDLKAYLH